MEIGLYQLKYPFRKLLDGLLPICKHTNPNTISLMLLPIGFITAVIYYYAPQYPYFYCLGIGLIFLRMVIGTLDGLVAEIYHKQTPNGTILNRLTPEIADWMLLLSIMIINAQHPILNYCALLMGWAVSYVGLLVLAGNKRIQSVGPVGQTDRLVALMIVSALQYACIRAGWAIDMLNIFIWWVILGGTVTLAVRTYRILIEKAHGSH